MFSEIPIATIVAKVLGMLLLRALSAVAEGDRTDGRADPEPRLLIETNVTVNIGV